MIRKLQTELLEFDCKNYRIQKNEIHTRKKLSLNKNNSNKFNVAELRTTQEVVIRGIYNIAFILCTRYRVQFA